MKAKKPWIDTRDRMPELDSEGISDDVLCITRKLGHNGVGHYPTIDYKVLWRDGDKWVSHNTEDFNSNPDHVSVTHWMHIPELGF